MAMKRKKPDKRTHLRLRIEPGLLARLEKSRVKDKHTLTGEIVRRIESSFLKEPVHPLETAVVQAMRELQGYDLAQRRMVEAIGKLRADIAGTQPPNDSLQDWGKEWAAFNSWHPVRLKQSV